MCIQLCIFRNTTCILYESEFQNNGVVFAVVAFARDLYVIFSPLRRLLFSTRAVDNLIYNVRTMDYYYVFTVQITKRHFVLIVLSRTDFAFRRATVERNRV